MIDKRLLTDTVTIKLLNEQDEWGKCSYSREFELSTVKFDRSVTISGTDNHKAKTKSSTLYIYPKFNPEIIVDDSWLNGIVNDGANDYKIIGYQTNPFKNNIFSYEVEVI